MDNKEFVDSLNNYVAGFGLDTNNVLSQGNYGSSTSKLLTKNRHTLTQMYRSSWIVGKVVDVIAEDMTKNGIDIVAGNSDINVNALQKKLLDLGVWEQISNTIKWGKLYGGAIGVLLIDGEDMTRPLDLERISKNSFKGIAVYDRWQVQPSFDLVTEYGPDFGQPTSYTVYPVGVSDVVDGSYTVFKDIHYSRVLKINGIDLPKYEQVGEQYWGESIVERLYDRILIFDSATYGASNLILKSYLRVLKMSGIKEGIAAGGQFLNNIMQYINSVQVAQSSTGMYVIDSDDELSTSSFSFSGMEKAINNFGEQLAGATGIPIVRLFGQPPAGFNSTGEIDLRSYFDTIKTNQRKYLTPLFNKLIPIVFKSEFGKDIGDDWSFDFVPLWQPSDNDKVGIAKQDVEIVASLIDKGIFDREMALDYLVERKRVTGRFGNITEADYAKEIESPAMQMQKAMGEQNDDGEPSDMDGKEEGEEKKEPKKEDEKEKGDK